MDKRILLIAHSREDVRNMLPLGAALRELDEGFEPLFVSLEPFFNQGVDTDLEAADVPFVTLDSGSGMNLRGEWRLTQLLRAIEETAPKAARLVDESAAIVCGHTGTIERTFARLAHDQGKPTAVFQPGILSKYEPTIRQRGRQLITRIAASVLSAIGRRGFKNRGRGQPFSDFTTVFAMGEDSCENLMSMGASRDAIVVTGLPRLAPVFEIVADQQERGSEPGVLYLTGAWQWHGDLLGDQIDKDYLRSLCAEATAWPELRVRIHPRDDWDSYGWCQEYQNVVLSDPRRDLLEDISDAAIVVARSSTAVFEGVVGGRIGILIAPPRKEEELARWEATGLDRLVRSDVADAVAFIDRAFGDSKWASEERSEQFRCVRGTISPTTPAAATLAAARIASQLSSGRTMETP